MCQRNPHADRDSFCSIARSFHWSLYVTFPLSVASLFVFAGIGMAESWKNTDVDLSKNVPYLLSGGVFTACTFAFGVAACFKGDVDRRPSATDTTSYGTVQN